MSTKAKIAIPVTTIPVTAKPKAILPLSRAPSQSLATIALDQQANITAMSPEMRINRIFEISHDRLVFVYVPWKEV